jgi:putative FmdB family regulatory protein
MKVIGKEIVSMPIYEYQCAACGQVVERWQKVSESPLAECPACGGGLHKLISSCAFHLKGSGWYVTDYGGSREAASDKNSDKNTDASKTASAPGESKPCEASAQAAAAPASKIK